MRLSLAVLFSLAGAAASTAAVLKNYASLAPSGMTSIPAMAVDAKGALYQVGTTNAPDFPTTPGPFSRYHGNNTSFLGGDVFVRKIAPDGATVVFSILLGGSGADYGTAIGVDDQGYIYVAGQTESADFPVTSHFPILRPPSSGNPDIFVVKLDPTASTILLARVFAGNGYDLVSAIAVAPDGRIVVAGATLSSDLPTTPNALQPANTVIGNTFFPLYGAAFVFRLSGDGSIDYGSYLGGSGGATCTDLAVDRVGDIYLTGYAGPFFPTLVSSFAPQATFGGFVSKLDHASGQLIYSTYLPGVTVSSSVSDPLPPKIKVDSAGQAYVAGSAGAGFLTTSGTFQTDYSSALDAFLLLLDASGSKLIFATYLGGAGDDVAFGLALTGDTITIAGLTRSFDFPARDHGLPDCNLPSLPIDDSHPNLWSGAFLARFDHTGRLSTSVRYSYCTDEYATALASGPDSVWIAGKYRTPYYAFVANVDLTVRPPVQIVAAGNAASQILGAPSPQDIFTIVGSGLGPAKGLAAPPGTTFPTQLGGTQVTVNGSPAPLLYVSDKQINAVMPSFPYGRTYQVGVSSTSGRAGEWSTWLAQTDLGLFTADGSGTGQAAALNQDGSYNSRANPAARGSVIVLFGTGGGITSPAGADGQVATGATSLFAGQPYVRFGVSPAPGVPAPAGVVTYAGAAPALVNGVVQINVRIPDNAPIGSTVPLTVWLYPSVSQGGVTVAIK